jgi:hypothetical protein
LDADERRWLESDDLNIPGFQEDKLPVWIESTTRNKPEDVPEGKFDTNILTKSSNPNDGVLVIQDSQGKLKDFINAQPGEGKPAWSDMAMHDWRSACTSEGR